MIKTDNNTLKVFNQGFFGVLSVTTIKMVAITPQRTKLTMTYKFLLSGWNNIFQFILPTLIERWNQRTWDEDLELKLRREKVLRYGFKDFQGLPKNIKDRRLAEEAVFNLPIRRHKNSPLNFFL